jgi:hypothetical protein
VSSCTGQGLRAGGTLKGLAAVHGKGHQEDNFEFANKANKDRQQEVDSLPMPTTPTNWRAQAKKLITNTAFWVLF